MAVTLRRWPGPVPTLSTAEIIRGTAVVRNIASWSLIGVADLAREWSGPKELPVRLRQGLNLFYRNSETGLAASYAFAS